MPVISKQLPVTKKIIAVVIPSFIVLQPSARIRPFYSLASCQVRLKAKR